MGQRGLGRRSEHVKETRARRRGARARGRPTSFSRSRAAGEAAKPASDGERRDNVLRSAGQRIRRGRLQSGRSPGRPSASRMRTARRGRRRRISRHDHYRPSRCDVPPTVGLVASFARRSAGGASSRDFTSKDRSSTKGGISRRASLDAIRPADLDVDGAAARCGRADSRGSSRSRRSATNDSR